MGDGRTFRVFVSAVSRELALYRREVARVLRRKGLEVRDQEHFHQGPGTLLEKLRDYIKECDAVILLVGERYGAFPTAEHVAALGPIDAFDRYRTASGQAGASYTQWELLLAKQFGRKTYVFFTAADFAPDQPNDEGDATRAMQAAYRTWIDHSGEHRDALITPAKLIEDVLVLPFPDLGRPKPISLPYPSLGTLFKGRDEFLERLRASLGPIGSVSSNARAAAVVGHALHGLGGVGKTRVAVEYAWRYEEEYSALLFVSAETPSALQSSLAGLCGPSILGLPEQAATDEGERVAATLRWLQNHPGWFLIIDNIDSKEAAGAAEKLLSSLHGGHVVLTARISEWSGDVEALGLEVLSSEAAAAFLLERTDERRRKAPDDAERAAALASELGQLALALEQAAAYISHRRMDFATYQSEWASKRSSVLGWYDERVMRYPRSVAITWQTSVSQLGFEGGWLLDLIAWLAPDAIPESLLETKMPTVVLIDLRAGLADLDAYCLVTRNSADATFTVHRLVQDVTRRRKGRGLFWNGLLFTTTWLNLAFTGDPQDFRDWPQMKPLMPHIRSVLNHAHTSGKDGEHPGWISRLARVLGAHGIYRVLNRTAIVCASVGGRLGILLPEMGLFAEAEPLLRRSLAITEAGYGPNRPALVEPLRRLAVLLRQTNRFSESELLMRRALAIAEVSHGANHAIVSNILNSLGVLLSSANREFEAEPLHRRSLAIAEACFGANHRRVANSLSNLAQTLRKTNRWMEAEPLMRRALAIDEAIYGPDHPSVAIRLGNLAGLLRDTNRRKMAESLYRRALVIMEVSYGPDHPDVALCLKNLATLLHEGSRKVKAEPLYRRALAIMEASYGPEHPITVETRKDLSILVQQLKRR